MTFAAIQERTGYLLANPQKFLKPRYEVETAALNYKELEILHYTVESIRDVALLSKSIQELGDTELSAKISMAATAEG